MEIVEDDELFVLVWFDAQLHRVPDDPSPLQAYDFGSTPRAARPGQVYVGRRLAHRGPWVRVGGVSEWLGEDNSSLHCIGSDVFDAPSLDLAVWVHERDLAPVLREHFDIQYDDGTFLSLRPGAAIVAGRPWVDGYTFPVEVPGALVGQAYALEASSPGSTPRLPDGSVFFTENFTVTLGGQLVPWTRPVWDYGHGRVASIVATDDAQPLLHARDCGEFVLAVELESEGQFEAPSPGGIMGGIGATQREHHGGAVRAGTPLLWPDGAPAGTVREDTARIDLEPGPSQLTCMAVAVGRKLQAQGYRGDEASVCVETVNIQAVTVRAP